MISVLFDTKMRSDFDLKSSVDWDIPRCKACERATRPRHKRSRASVIFTILSIVHIVTVRVSGTSHKGLDMCEPIDIPLCAGMPYNMTRMPNHLHHSTQENARLAIEPYGELVKQNCSADLLFFLCAMFAPICTPHFQKEAIPPCRSVCERSRRGCEPLMNSYNFSWPEDLDCSELPEYDKGVCVSPEAIVSSMPTENNQVIVDTSVPVNHKPTNDCLCQRRKPTKKIYRKGNYDFALGCTVKRITPIDANTTVVRVLVDKILQRGKVHLQENREMDIWADSDCVCPLKENRQYLIIGKEEVLLNRLRFGHVSLVSRWKRKWETKFKTWEDKKKKQKGKKNKKRQCKKKGCKKNRSKTKLRCRVEQVNESKKRLKCIRPESNEINPSTPKEERRNKRKNINTSPNSTAGR